MKMNDVWLAIILCRHEKLVGYVKYRFALKINQSCKETRLTICYNTCCTIFYLGTSNYLGLMVDDDGKRRFENVAQVVGMCEFLKLTVFHLFLPGFCAFGVKDHKYVLGKHYKNLCLDDSAQETK
jgi:hypothetical protein